MNKWVCYVCNSTFDEPDIWHYREDMNGEGAWQDFYVPICPCCRAEGIQEESEDLENGKHEY